MVCSTYSKVVKYITAHKKKKRIQYDPLKVLTFIFVNSFA